MTELEPCPFCGGEVVPPDFEDGDCVYWIDHDKECILNERDFNVRALFDTEIPAWNRRASDAD